MGRLRWVPGADIERAFQGGELTHDDILMTDVVPAELPYLNGIISLAPATPNSRVAILARHHGIPFVYASDTALVDTLTAACDHEVLLRTIEPVDRRDLRERVKVLIVDDIDPAFKADMRMLKQAPALTLSGKRRHGLWIGEVFARGRASRGRPGGFVPCFLSERSRTEAPRRLCRGASGIQCMEQPVCPDEQRVCPFGTRALRPRGLAPL